MEGADGDAATRKRFGIMHRLADAFDEAGDRLDAQAAMTPLEEAELGRDVSVTCPPMYPASHVSPQIRRIAGDGIDADHRSSPDLDGEAGTRTSDGADPGQTRSCWECRRAGEIECAVLAALDAVLVRLSVDRPMDANRHDECLRIMRITRTPIGEKAIERTFAIHWSPAHVELHGPAPKPRTIRRWCLTARNAEAGNSGSHAVSPGDRPTGPRNG